MKSNLAAGVLTTLIYAQVALCFVGVATVLLRDRGETAPVAAIETDVASVPAIRL